MDYKEKYKKALRKALDLYNQGLINPPLEHIFPELKESEDEKIKREIVAYINELADLKNEKIPTKWITWLEKQEEKVTNINGEEYGIDGLYHAIRILEKTVGKVTGYQSDDGILEHKAAINAVKELYKKQGGQEPTDKIEPKFKVGDKVVAKCHKTDVKTIEKVSQYGTYWTSSKEFYSGWWGEDELEPYVEHKTLDSNKVIAWLVANICDFEHYVKLFKKDFGL